MFLQLLSKPNTLLVEQAIWGLGNIAGDNIETRDLMLLSNTMSFFVALYEQVKVLNVKMRDQIIWAASNLCRMKPSPDLDKILEGFSMFAETISSTKDVTVQIDCAWSLSTMCKKKTAMKFYEMDLLPVLVDLLHADDIILLQLVAKMIGTLTSGGPEICEVIFS